MKNQYVGDIGDYGKYGLLRFLASHGIKIGVNWYLTENDGSTDGKFTTYLKNPADRLAAVFLVRPQESIIASFFTITKTYRFLQIYFD